ncbi:Hemolysin [Pandoraea eparura]|uniref:Hemolysin n=2 Tax=Pandoraea eparura TaxID=2508291 RepID=A0A5E4Y8L8_9BURK|nr:Hemolysin [Pandoraea eparura]
MHAAGGAIVAGLGGGNALGGAFGAGLTSKLGGALNELSNEIKNASPTGNADIDQALGQIVATGVGTAVGAVAGRTSGAFTGFNTDRFNRQLGSEDRKLAGYIADKSNGQYTQGQVEDQLRLMGVSYADGASVPPGVVEELNGSTPTDQSARWVDTGVTSASGKPLIVQSLPEVNQALQAFIMANYDSATPGQIPSAVRYIPNPVATDIRDTVVNAAQGVSTTAGRLGALTSAGASIPSPYAPELATAALIAAATGLVADAVVQIAKPDVGRYLANSGSAIISDQISRKYPIASPAINEASNTFNNSIYSKSIQDFINSSWTRINHQPEDK